MQLALPFWARPTRRPRDTIRTAPERKRVSGPVYIHDAITPFGGETLLLSVLRAQAEAAAHEDDES